MRKSLFFSTVQIWVLKAKDICLQFLDDNLRLCPLDPDLWIQIQEASVADTMDLDPDPKHLNWKKMYLTVLKIFVSDPDSSSHSVQWLLRERSRHSTLKTQALK